MTHFNINFKDLKQSINDYRISCNNTIESVNTINSNLKNVDSAWNDSNTLGYIETLKVHKYKINNYFDELNQLFNEIDIFKSKFNQLSSKYFNKRDFENIRYDESKIETCINKLNNVLSSLSNAGYYINNYKYNNNFDELYRLRNLRNTISYMKNDVNNILTKLKNIKRDINNIIYDTKVSINKKSSIDLDIKPLEYQWKVNVPDLK